MSGTSSIRLPGPDGELITHVLGRRGSSFDQIDRLGGVPPASRSVYAAGHVVLDPLAEPVGLLPSSVDWDATLRFRHHLWSIGLGVAEAMDTAQRGMGLGWDGARELIRRSCAEARAVGGRVVCGAQTDQLPSGVQGLTLDRIIEAYQEQVAWVEQCGGTPVVMASRHLAALARGADDYERVYDAVLAVASGPVFLHWLGESFDPDLAGYWGDRDLDAAQETFLRIVQRHRATVVGVKISLLDAEREVAVRRLLPPEVRMHTGDDFNYVDLIRGDDQGHSDALLGVFDALAVPARVALARLDDGDAEGFVDILEPTVPLARHLFAAPTSAYKTGVVFLAWLNGHQDHFRMLAGAETMRSVPHLARVFALADHAGALADPDLAQSRLRHFLAMAGVET